MKVLENVGKNLNEEQLNKKIEGLVDQVIKYGEPVEWPRSGIFVGISGPSQGGLYGITIMTACNEELEIVEDKISDMGSLSNIVIILKQMNLSSHLHPSWIMGGIKIFLREQIEGRIIKKSQEMRDLHNGIDTKVTCIPNLDKGSVNKIKTNQNGISQVIFNDSPNCMSKDKEEENADDK